MLHLNVLERFHLSSQRKLSNSIVWSPYLPTMPHSAHVIHPFSIGWLQNISIIESICISVTVQVCNIYNDPKWTSYLWIFEKLKSSMPIKLQWVTNLFLQNQVSNQFSQCMEWIELNFQTKEHQSSLDRFLFIQVRQKIFTAISSKGLN